MAYNFRKTEKKWREKWGKDKLYEVDLSKAKKPFYNLMMFPYPSAEGLHVGNMYAFVHSDTYGRFIRLKGYDVFEPIGLDGFGIHSENYAIKIGEHIKDVSARTEKNFYNQLHMIGNAYDWSRTVETYKPEYYKWTQWLFLKMYEKGLAYRKEAPVNWCPSCKTVLSDEQVIDEKCERCGTKVEQRQTEQWFFKITNYAEKLLRNLETIDWSEDVKLIQKNWIGKSEGALIKFPIKDSDKILEIFTTRPDTLDGCTFMVVSPAHEFAHKNLTAVNPFNKKEIPVLTDEYVLGDYGTGAIMAVPSHDERDMEFAKKNNLPVVDTRLKEDMIDWLVEKGVGEKAIRYKLRDWCVSRQRYWGPPIPMIECPKCGWVPVPEKDLPVLLPEMDDFLPDGSGKGPLNKVEDFVNTKCPKCGGPAKRETDVSDPFVDSSWYYLRYLCTEFNDEPLDKKRLAKWMPVSMYVGGKEHSVLHLLYSRFVTMVMHELGYVPEEEPFKKFRAHGLLIKEGAKISKSKGNIVNPDEYIEKFGADTVRMYLMFLGDMRQGGDWRDEGIMGVYRFLNKIHRLKSKVQISNSPNENSEFEKVLHKAIKKVTEDLENLKFNTAISQMMILANEMEKSQKLTANSYKLLVIMLAPFAPFITEELWEQLGNKDSIHEQKWPKYDLKKIKEKTFELVVQVNGKVRDTIEAEVGIEEKEAQKIALQSEKIQKFLEDKQVKKTIYIKDKILNIVV